VYKNHIAYQVNKMFVLMKVESDRKFIAYDSILELLRARQEGRWHGFKAHCWLTAAVYKRILPHVNTEHYK